MKVEYKPSGRQHSETIEFASSQEYEGWLQKQALAEWADFCQGQGDGSLSHLQIRVKN